ncbi:MAG: restriction endonuclease [Desulfovermiculus sp.]|nr:restriction endonuclease [Desulfovermiculus sp.]
MGKTEKWKDYEEVSQYLISKFSENFGLSKVEGKQKLVGKESGTEWEVDAKGIREENDCIVIIEARRYTKNRLNQEQLGAIAYRIHDTGAHGGIIVSPLGIQSGAKKIAESNNIVSVEIDANSTKEKFAINFFGNLIMGVPTDKISIRAFSPTVYFG